MIECIAFDLDGTLYDEHLYAASCYRAIANEMVPWHADEAVQLMMQVRQTEGDRYVFQRFLAQYDLPESAVVRCVEIYRNCDAAITLYADAERFLSSASKERLALLTNGGVATQSNKCRLLNLDHYFAKLLMCGHLPRERWKPASEAFAWLCSEMQIQPEKCLFVGDSMKNDYAGAEAAGLHACLIDRTDKEYDDEVCRIRSMDELYDLISRMDV